MEHRSIARHGRVLVWAILFAALFVPNATLSAQKDKDVVITNVPLPVTGSVNATITNPITGAVNATIVNTPLPVSGTVNVANLPGALPANPFAQSMTLIAGGDKKAVGVNGARLAVTTLTLSNFDGNSQQLFLFDPVMNGGSCGGSVIGGGSPSTTVILPAYSTTQLQFPVPRVFDLNGLGCIAAEVTTVLSGGSVIVDVVGFTAP